MKQFNNKHYRILVMCFYFINFSLLTFHLRASHIAGQDLSFKTIGSTNKYDIIVFTFNSYRNCSGMAENTTAGVHISSSCTQSTTNWFNEIISMNYNKYPNITFDGDSNGFSFYLGGTYGLINKTEISQLCPTEKSVCQAGPNPGIESYLWRDTLKLPRCSDWLITSSRLARDKSVNVPKADIYMHYTEIKFDNQNVKANNSPVFVAQPTPYFCVNQSQTYNLLAYDPDGDSLHFSFFPTRSASSNALIYNNPYSYDEPITGITMNENTGLIQFTPTTIGNFIVVVQVKEYRDGKLIGTYMRDSKYVIINCNNQVPSDTSGSITNLSTSAYGIKTGKRSVEICSGGTFSFDITINDPDTADKLTLGSNITQALQGATFTIDTTKKNPAKATVTWTIPDNSPYYNTFQIMANDGKCPIPGETYYDYEIKVTPGIAVNDATLCDSTETVQLIAKGDTAFTWKVLYGDFNSLSCTSCSNPIAYPNITTVYEVTNSVVNTGCKTKDTATVTVLNNPPLTIMQAGPFCLTDTTTLFQAQPTGGIWYGKGINNSGSFTPSDAGTGTHIISYYTSGICGDTATTNIIVNEKYDVIISSAGPYCLNDTPDTLKAIPPGGIWSGNGVDTNTGLFTPTTAGSSTHIVKYTIAGSCGDVDSVSIIVNPLPDITINPVKTLLETDPPVELTATVPAGTWTGTGIIDSLSGIFNPAVAQLGTHSIIYTITDVNGCINTGTILIIVERKSSLAFPNVFTPNGDEYNNVFKPIPDSTKNILDFYIVIYNRWGKRIYEWNDIEGNWDGTTSNGNKAPDGVYFYIVSAKGRDNTIYEQSGTVTLIGNKQ